MNMKKYGKMSSIEIEFTILNIGYAGIFLEIWDLIFVQYFKGFLTNEEKNEDEDEKIWGNDFNFWIRHTKIILCGSFYENPWKSFLTHLVKYFLANRGKNEDEDKARENNFDFLILHIKIGLCGSFHEKLRKNFLTHFVRHFWLIEAKMKMKIKK